MRIVTRFAPSPTGDLHLGHAFAAAFAHRLAREAGGTFLVRIEDIDAGRCRPQFVERILDDLRWLGFAWAEPPLRQSQRLPVYRQALDRLRALGVVYPCFCTRKQIQDEVNAAAAAPHAPAVGIYPGTCRALGETERAAARADGRAYALRLDAGRALALTGPLTWTDARFGAHAVSAAGLGDVVLARKDVPTSYHLSVVVDDAAQGVTCVTRGEDLLPATNVHRLLYALLDLPAPVWHHHPLCRDETGARLAKRHRPQTLRRLRADGMTPAQVIACARRAALAGDGVSAPPLA